MTDKFDLEAIETKINSDDHECTWIGGTSHSDMVGIASELLDEVKKLREEIRNLRTGGNCCDCRDWRQNTAPYLEV